MNADDAFDKLMHENRLAIPVARPDPAQAFAKAGAVETMPRPLPTTPARDDSPSRLPSAMTVNDVVDGDSDYVPVYEEVADMGGMSGSPTETNLEAVPEEEPTVDLDPGLEGALESGAVLVGRDLAAPVSQRLRAKHEPVPETYRGGANLAVARRVRRFAQLPLAGAEWFESAAREIAAGLAVMDPEHQSLLITSAARGEGRTELAIRVALAMAKRVGSRVLLVDFDVRNPRVAPRLGLPIKYFALAEALRGTCPLEEALTVSDEDNLYVLPARPSDRDGDEVVDARRTGALMADIHASFDFAVIDCGPVGKSSTLALSRQVGAVALAGFRGLTTAGRMEAAAAKVESAGARVAGMLLAGM